MQSIYRCSPEKNHLWYMHAFDSGEDTAEPPCLHEVLQFGARIAMSLLNPRAMSGVISAMLSSCTAWSG